MIKAATPMVACRAKSRIAGISISEMTAKPSASDTSATKPARHKRLNVMRAAT
ncbi:hypothetical protein D3C85_1665660 [compost metagenome]